MSDTMSDDDRQEIANDVQGDFLQRIQSAIYSTKLAPCCAGSIPITQEGNFAKIKDHMLDHQSTSTPVVIRWDRKDGETTSKLTLPLAFGDTKNHVALQDLLDDCAPATFGKDGKDILDESYRKAVKLDSSQFSTNFSPYDLGIIGAITQTMLPCIGQIKDKAGEKTLDECQGVIAELYKLNVYSAPSGKFLPHVDTPRGATQFGTLVVCLPYRHQGGQLRVAHKTPISDLETTFEWGDQDTEIKWAAFYSDYEHEVYEVTAGHRITLTYNLYAHEQLGGVFQAPSTIDMDSLTLYHRAKEALASPKFLPDGGTLGFHCAHAYAHANDRVIADMPWVLKGMDAMVYSIFERMGLQVKMHAVMEELHNDYDDDQMDSDDEIKGAELVSTGLHGIQISELGEDESSRCIEIVPDAWYSRWRKDIHWFGGPRNQEIAVVHLAYGNQASQEWHYSTAAILIKIPDKESEKRKALISQ